ncbi:MAG: T9SS type A sorting domain-containing protein [FCB group bacterium]|nr:T9SS type A sorting domain-containing protein [FCB group bacterium]
MSAPAGNKRFFPLLIAFTFWLTPARSQVTGLSGWNIFIDPGHSQTENMGVNGYSEAEEALRVARQLKDILLTQTDIDTVYLSRTNDTQNVDLYQRTSRANSLRAAWYHSIHSNAGSPSQNNTLLLWGQLYDGTPDPPEGGEAMSAVMVDLLTRGMRIPTIGSRGDCSFYSYTGACSASWPGPYLHVNRESVMPSELSEEGYHTNPTQNQLFMNAEYKRMVAYTFYWSILRYHKIDRPFVGISAGIISDRESGKPINGAVAHLNGQTYVTDTYESLFHKYSDDPDKLRNGFYYFEGLPNDTLELIVEADGYYSDTTTIVVNDTFITFRDVSLLSSRPPFVVATTPVSGDTLFPARNPITIDFSREMDIASTERSFSIAPSVNGYFSWSRSRLRLRFHPDSLALETRYAITIADSAKDAYGHQLDGDGDGIPGGNFVLNFRTGPADMSPPRVTDLYPPSLAKDIELQPIVRLTFDEIIDSATVRDTTLRLIQFSTGNVVRSYLAHYVINSRSVLTLFPMEQLLPITYYDMVLSPGFADRHGNAAPQTQSSRFRTGNRAWDIRGIDDFESDVETNWWPPQSSGSTTGIITEETRRSAISTIVNHATGSTRALAIDYGWDVNAGSWLIREYLATGTPRDVYFKSTTTLQVYVFGDGSGNRFRFCVDDKVPVEEIGNHEVSPWYTVDWLGWKLVTWDITNDGTGTWIGDGTPDGTLRFDSIQLTYMPGNPAIGRFIFDDLRIVKETSVAIVNEPTGVLSGYSLAPNYPNPFNPRTTIEYRLPARESIDLSIYNLRGERVRTLVTGSKPAGTHRVVWDGQNDRGNPVASGIYFYRLITTREILSRQMLLLK